VTHSVIDECAQKHEPVMPARITDAGYKRKKKKKKKKERKQKRVCSNANLIVAANMIIKIFENEDTYIFLIGMRQSLEET